MGDKGESLGLAVQSASTRSSGRGFRKRESCKKIPCKINPRPLRVPVYTEMNAHTEAHTHTEAYC